LQRPLRPYRPFANDTDRSRVAQKDDDYSKVVALSRQTAADKDLEKAIQMSLGGASSMQVDSDVGIPISEDERLLNEAVLKSLSSASAETGNSVGGREPTALERRRDGLLPVGLRNVGNTCYLNSLIQAYFGVPSFRNTVLRVPAAPPAGITDAQKPTLEFIKALQKLFAQLLLSNQSFIDPSPMIKALRTDDGRPVTIGGQEDVAEFNELFLQRVREGLNLTMGGDVGGQTAPATPLKAASAPSTALPDVSPIPLKLGGEQKRPKHNGDGGRNDDDDDDDGDGDGGAVDLRATTDTLNTSHREPDFVTRLFAGTSLNMIEATERTGEPVTMRNRESFSSLILPVTDVGGSEQPLTLYRAIDGYVQNELDFTTPRGYQTRARSTTWIERLPRVLVVHESRVQFSAATSSAHKCSRPLLIADLIHLDRYLLACRDEALQARERVRVLDERLARLVARLHLLETLPQALVQSHSFIEQEGGGNIDDSLIADEQGNALAATSAQARAATLAVLTAARNDALARLAVLTNEKARVEQEIDAAYHGLRQNGYRLLAVCIHSGIPSSGHYWAYVRRLGAGAPDAATLPTAAATSSAASATSFEAPADVSWTRFNDRMVSTVTSTDVWRDAVGARDSSTSAYMLLYVDASSVADAEALAGSEASGSGVSDVNASGALAALAARHGIPDDVVRAIEQENASFRKSCEDASKQQDDASARQCVERLRTKWTETENHANTKDDVRDPLCKSFFAWLICAKQRELAACEVFKEVYVITFERGVLADGELDSTRARRVLELCSEAGLAQFAPTTLRRLLQLERTDGEHQKLLESNRHKHAQYVSGARLIEQMLTALHNKDYLNASSRAQLALNDLAMLRNSSAVIGGSREKLTAETLAVAAMALAEQSLLQLHGAFNELSSAGDGRTNAHAAYSEETALGAALQHLRTLYRACRFTSMGAKRGAAAYIATRVHYYSNLMRSLARSAHVDAVLAYLQRLGESLYSSPLQVCPIPKDLFPVSLPTEKSMSEDAAVLRELLLNPDKKLTMHPTMSPQQREELSNRLADVERRCRAMHSALMSALY
jgi:hypothetical protein